MRLFLIPFPWHLRQQLLKMLPMVWMPAEALHAQQAIVNLPSADITPKGKHFLMHETQTRPWSPGRSWAGTNFYTYGLGHATELAVTSYNGGLPPSPSFATGIGFKSAPQFWTKSNPALEAKLTIGQMVILSHRGSGVGSFSYLHGSARLPETATRISLGGWAGTRQLFGRNTGGMLVGLEHPVGRNWVLLGEWFSGRHDFGFLIPGILFHPRKEQIVVLGFKIPNHPANGTSGLVMEYGITF